MNYTSATQKNFRFKLFAWQRVVIKAKFVSGQTKKKNLCIPQQKTLHPARGFGFIPPCRSRFKTPPAAG
jgi:hypothetical protein